jgi:hypothetical protein
VKARKIALLLLFLAFGATLEVAHDVRDRLSLGPEGCRVLGGRFYGPSYSFETEERRALRTPLELQIDNAFGEVVVHRGPAGELTARLRKVVHLPDEESARRFADQVELQVGPRGAGIRISTNRETVIRTEDVGLETHLEVLVPEDSKVSVGSEHGRVEVADVAQATVRASFEPVEVRGISGQVELETRHAPVRIAEVEGPLSLDSRHGDVEIEDVARQSTLKLRRGTTTLARVGRCVAEIDYGDLQAEGIRGDLEVTAEHAGVVARDIAGSARVTTSYRAVELHAVTRDAAAETSHGSVSLEKVGGRADAKTSFDDVVLDDIQGPVDVIVSHGGVTGTHLAAGGRVSVSGDDVSLVGFAGPVSVTAERGEVRLEPGEPLVTSLDVVADGAIRLAVPPDSRFDLDATAARDTVEAEIDGLEILEAKPHALDGRIGGGGARVVLRSARGRIHLEPAPSPAPEARP